MEYVFWDFVTLGAASFVGLTCLLVATIVVQRRRRALVDTKVTKGYVSFLTAQFELDDQTDEEICGKWKNLSNKVTSLSAKCKQQWSSALSALEASHKLLRNKLQKAWHRERSAKDNDLDVEFHSETFLDDSSNASTETQEPTRLRRKLVLQEEPRTSQRKARGRRSSLESKEANEYTEQVSVPAPSACEDPKCNAALLFKSGNRYNTRSQCMRIRPQIHVCSRSIAQPA